MTDKHRTYKNYELAYVQNGKEKSNKRQFVDTRISESVLWLLKQLNVCS